MRRWLAGRRGQDAQDAGGRGKVLVYGDGLGAMPGEPQALVREGGSWDRWGHPPPWGSLGTPTCGRVRTSFASRRRRSLGTPTCGRVRTSFASRRRELGPPPGIDDCHESDSAGCLAGGRRTRVVAAGTTKTTLSDLEEDTLHYVRVTAQLDPSYSYQPSSIFSVVTLARRDIARSCGVGGWRSPGKAVSLSYRHADKAPPCQPRGAGDPVTGGAAGGP